MFVITGTVAYDYIMDFPGLYKDHILPDQIHKINLSFIVNTFEKRRGGTAGNVCYSLVLLKTPHLLFTYAGKDFIDYKKDFEKLKIDTKEVKIDIKKYTSTGFAMTDRNDNQIWGFFYGATDNIPKLKLSKVVKKGDTVLIGPSGAKGSMSFVDQCISAKIPYIFDPGFILTQVSNAQLTRGVKNAKYLIGNDYEIETISRRVKGFNTISKTLITIKTLGSKGSEIIVGGKTTKIAPVILKNVVDPTGAGDAWRSGFIAGLEKKLDLITCAKVGSVAASFAVEKYGTQKHSYTIKEFKTRYRHTYKSLLDW